MPSDQSTWIISAPLNGDSEGIVQELTTKLVQQSKSISANSIAELGIPSFKTGTLDSLIALSEDLPKQDTFFTNTVAKVVDTLRNLLNNDPSKLSQHILVNESSIESYLLGQWRWNESRYGVQKGLRDMVDTLNKEMTSIDNAMRAKLTNYNLVKGSLVQMQRKKTGNLSVRSLADVVSKENFIQDSEYLETLLAAVPKFTIRDFIFSEEEIVKQRQELDTADVTERELWTELLHLSRTNFSESFQILVHLKVIRLFVESVLRYGLPANYIGIVIQPDPKSAKKTFSILQSHFSYLGSGSHSRGTKLKGGDTEEFVGEYQTLMEQEFYDFVLYEVPWVTQ
ncbi:hypothetical protein HHX47_DHR1001448 [Lentinula edodes]|nr:hypothetical protein HHX47_DHR1001448 [Lentinula edodes]